MRCDEQDGDTTDSTRAAPACPRRRAASTTPTTGSEDRAEARRRRTTVETMCIHDGYTQYCSGDETMNRAAVKIGAAAPDGKATRERGVTAPAAPLLRVSGECGLRHSDNGSAPEGHGGRDRCRRLRRAARGAARVNGLKEPTLQRARRKWPCRARTGAHGSAARRVSSAGAAPQRRYAAAPPPPPATGWPTLRRVVCADRRFAPHGALRADGPMHHRHHHQQRHRHGRRWSYRHHHHERHRHTSHHAAICQGGEGREDEPKDTGLHCGGKGEGEVRG